MSAVQTVTGPVPAGELGIVDYHEHLVFDAPPWLVREDPDFRLDDVEKSAAELRTWAAAGGRTIIEMSAIDFGRNVGKVREVAEREPEVHIIVITGFNKPYYCDAWVWQSSEDELVRRLMREVGDGIDGTGIRPGIVKGGSGYNVMGERDRKLLRVAGRIHLESGLPIITHTEAGTMGMEHLELLSELGVPPRRICLSHMDRNPDLWLHRNICRTGAYLGYDCAGKTKYGPDSARIAVLRALIEEGFGDRILLGNDLGRPSYWRSYGGGPGLDFVLTRFVPRLRDEGIPEAAIQDLLVHNPRRFLARE